MYSLKELCEPRDNVFDEKKREDVLDLIDLSKDKIDPKLFFEENFKTDGMNLLLSLAFKRFSGEGESGIIKLTQSMGGGKTHNMIALGLLAKHPEYREKILENKNFEKVGKIRVVAFTGRETDAPYGIWGSIAEQLGKKNLFNDYYAPLKAPGQEAWVNLLKGEPLLILLDELPPYLENAKSIQIGNSDLSVVTTTALANLFNAISRDELSNVCLVISDLNATYESGSDLLKTAFKELKGEIERFSQNITPVNSASDEIYHILRKKLFKVLPNNEEINKVALDYKDSMTKAKNMGFTSITPEQIYIGVKDSYPFHPSIKDLYARFKENQGFQQTRGLIRLMRLIVNELYSTEAAERKNLINSYDVNLNNQEQLTAILSIKNSLSNAISHDISSRGQAMAEVIDQEHGNELAEDMSKLILISSLADIPNALLGLTISEIIAYLVEPRREISQIKEILGSFQSKAWYLHVDADNKLFFQNQRNLIAEMNALVDSYDYSAAKKELKEILKGKFEPKLKDCYQNLYVFPAMDEIKLDNEKTSLIIIEPSSNGLSHDVSEFYENQKYKNRILFLTGTRQVMDSLLKLSKEYKALITIKDRMKNEKIPESNPQYKTVVEEEDRKKLQILQSAREAFTNIYYPTLDKLAKADILMKFDENNYDGERQIKDILIGKQKFVEKIDENLRKKCEVRIFTSKEMRWIDIKERAATNPQWQLHIPGALEDVLENAKKMGEWRDNGGYIEKGPFPKEKTFVDIREIYRDQKTGEVTLKLIPRFGDEIYFEINGEPTKASAQVIDLDSFKTSELKINFIAIDSKGEHPTGDYKEWKNKILLKIDSYDKGNQKILQLESIPKAEIRYTTDGSNPKTNGGIYDGEVTLPENCRTVLAIAEKDGIISEQIALSVLAGTKKIEINPEEKLYLKKKIKTDSTIETYKELEILKNMDAKMEDISIEIHGKKEGNDHWLDLHMGDNFTVSPVEVENMINSLRNVFNKETNIIITITASRIEFTNGEKFQDYIAAKKQKLEDYEVRDIEQKWKI